MRPVLAAPTIAAMAFSFSSSVNHHLDLHLGQKVNGVFAAAIELGVTLLTAVAAGLENRHSFNACFEQRILNSVQL